MLLAGSRNAAYLASQAAEHLLRAVATSEGLHIERKDAHQLDATARRLPEQNPDRAALARLGFLEAYSTTYRYPTPAGRIPASPNMGRIESALDSIDALLAVLRSHHGIHGLAEDEAGRTDARR